MDHLLIGNCIVEDRNQNDDCPALINIGSCSLHAVYGAFRSGVQKTKWEINGVLKAVHNLFDESSAKWDYQNITGSKGFLLPLCGQRWIEDKKVTDRAFDVWPNNAKYVNETLKKRKSKIPGLSSFATLETAVQDGLIVAKLHFISSDATIMMPYL